MLQVLQTAATHDLIQLVNGHEMSLSCWHCVTQYRIESQLFGLMAPGVRTGTLRCVSVTRWHCCVVAPPWRLGHALHTSFSALTIAAIQASIYWAVSVVCTHHATAKRRDQEVCTDAPKSDKLRAIFLQRHRHKLTSTAQHYW